VLRKNNQFIDKVKLLGALQLSGLLAWCIEAIRQ
jgi:hypothetical protein